MKKFLFSFFLILSINIYAARSDMYGNKGLELMREGNLNQIFELNKKSGSLQTFESYFEKNKNVKSKGLLLGTVSNFLDAPNTHAGLTIAYQKYKFKDLKSNFKEREYALNTYLSHRKNDYLFMVGMAYAQSKNLEKRAYSGVLEVGKFFKSSNFGIFDRGNLYIYSGMETNKWKFRNNQNIKFGNYRLGLSTYYFINKFRLNGNIEVNADNKKYDFDRGKYNFAFSYAVAYQIYDDLLVELKYKGTKNKKFYNSLVSLGFSHTF